MLSLPFNQLSQLRSGFDSEAFVMSLIVLFGSISLHEFAHAKSADAAGDPTPRNQGRVTLNPVAHFDSVGAIMILITSFSGFGIGWGRPVMMHPNKMRNPKWDHFMAVLWGPLTNLLIAIVFALVLRLLSNPVEHLALMKFSLLAVIINVSLCLFNLIPLGPLDGHWLLAALLPSRMGERFGYWSRTTGTYVLFGLILMDQIISRNGGTGILGTVLGPPGRALLRLLVGPIF